MTDQSIIYQNVGIASKATEVKLRYIQNTRKIHQKFH